MTGTADGALEWLESPEGEAWSQDFHDCVSDAFAQLRAGDEFSTASWDLYVAAHMIGAVDFAATTGQHGVHDPSLDPVAA